MNALRLDPGSVGPRIQEPKNEVKYFRKGSLLKQGIRLSDFAWNRLAAFGKDVLLGIGPFYSKTKQHSNKPRSAIELAISFAIKHE